MLLRHLHRWHWISAALCLMGMLLFAVTGITLNHAGSIQGRAATLTREAVVPPALVRLLAGDERQERQAKLPLPVELSEWIAREIGAATAGRDAEWSAREIYLALPGPGTDAWITIDRSNGAVLYERTDRGWIAYLNDLHKGRNTGIAWSLFIDLFAVGCIVFCVTGLFLLQLHAQRRPLTWPMVAIGFVAPLLLLMVLVHV